MNDKVPLVIIIAVVIFILIFIVVIASYEDSSESTKILPYSYKKQKSNPLASNTQLKYIIPGRHLDALVTEFKDLTNKESIIFGGNMRYSNVSIYKNDILVYTKLFSGSNGFVISTNQQNVNASFFQIGKKIDLENIKYTYIPIDSLSDKDSLKIVVSSVSDDTFKIYRCFFDYDLVEDNVKIHNKSLNIPFGISEYDLEKYIISKHNNLLDNFQTVPMQKYPIQRSIDKKNKRRWEFYGTGNYIVYYIKGLYSYSIVDQKNNINITQNTLHNESFKTSLRSINSHIENNKVSLESFYITDPNLIIENFDENIPEKNLNSDLISLLNTPVEFYRHFVYGKKNIPIDIWNRIQNKIMIFKF